MVRVCINNATGKLIESQSGGDGEAALEVLRENAASAGLLDVSVSYVDDAVFRQLLAAAEEKSVAELTETDYQAAVQNALDAGAKERNYDGILSLCSYATSTNPVFAAEGQAGVVRRDGAWAKCYELLAQWQAGQITQPTLGDVLAAIPPMVWPT